jgi:hypothetical protein
MSDEYQPVPVQVARKIAAVYAKQCVVIACYDERYQKTHVTTYGQEPHHKEMAANAGDEVGRVLSHSAVQEIYEDFRNQTEAGWAQQKDELIREMESRAVVVENCINILRNEEGSSVTILCENPEGGGDEPLNVIEVCDDWTGWNPRRFGGNTLREALETACRMKREWNPRRFGGHTLREALEEACRMKREGSSE